MQSAAPSDHVSADTTAVNIFILLATVTFSGGAVMILELLGTRIIAPFYGVSLFVWTALISVTMIALALGYYVGGFLTDRFPAVRLPQVFLLASVSTALIPFISGPVMVAADPLGIRGGAFASALLLFTLPLTALAMVGPFVIKQATRDLRGVGRAVGSVYAISTMGSVFGTLLLAFYLLPQFGTRAIIFCLSMLLLAFAILLWVLERRKVGQVASAFPFLLAAVITCTMTANGYAKPQQAVKGFKVLHEEESMYGWVRVVDDERKGFRLLLSDSSVLSAVEKVHGHSLLGYQFVLGLVPPLFRPQANQALLIGLGGGHVARDLKSKGLTTDTIEIDPAVADAAKHYFNFSPTGEFLVGDARYEINKLHKQYDFIIHDCFTGGSEPTHMLTVEMLSKLKGMLTESGILALNYVGYTHGEGANAVTSVYKTLASVLPNIRVFTTEKGEFTDFIFLASRQPLEMDRSNPNLERAQQWLLDHEFAMTDAGGIIISDDYNPMESLQVRKAESYRKIFMERIAPELLIL